MYFLDIREEAVARAWMYLLTFNINLTIFNASSLQKFILYRLVQKKKYIILSHSLYGCVKWQMTILLLIQTPLCVIPVDAHSGHVNICPRFVYKHPMLLCLN